MTTLVTHANKDKPQNPKDVVEMIKKFITRKTAKRTKSECRIGDLSDSDRVDEVSAR